MYVCTYVRTYVRTYVCMYVYTICLLCVYIYIHMWLKNYIYNVMYVKGTSSNLTGWVSARVWRVWQPGQPHEMSVISPAHYITMISQGEGTWCKRLFSPAKTKGFDSSNMCGTPIAGWFIRENPSINGWFRGTPIYGSPMEPPPKIGNFIRNSPTMVP